MTNSSKINEVYEALKAVAEGGGYVYLDNVDLVELQITEKQFSGFCSALKAMDLYETTGDKYFGIVK